jgi:DNA helicase-2/ATP-dependent DNA helicase PcrA
LRAEIEGLEAAQASGRAGSKAAVERAESIRRKTERLRNVETVTRFKYSPTSDNRGRDSLNHVEVINLAAAFLTEKAALSHILVHQYPILFIDESQDTNQHLMDALLVVERKHQKAFCLGLFGDTMQRIYADGKIDLEGAIPADWAKPVKRMNHRCPGRVLALLNQMRSETDHQVQQGRTDKPEGTVRLFILPENSPNKQGIETRIAARMAAITGDGRWENDYKGLILEHHMAAKRLGFAALFENLYSVDHYRQGLLDGSLPTLNFFSKQILPLVEAMQRDDRFAATAIVKKFSPLLDSVNLKEHPEQLHKIKEAKEAVEDLTSLWNGGTVPTFGEVLDSVYHTGLFLLPETLQVLAATRSDQSVVVDETSRDEEMAAWDRVLNTPFIQAASYDRYISGTSPFDTHQGVKGREFPRVMVVIDDSDSRGFMFSYEKLFGVREKTRNDL